MRLGRALTLAYVLTHEGCTSADICRATGRAMSTVAEQLQALREAGLVQPVRHAGTKRRTWVRA